MKKAICFLLLTAVILSFGACSKKIYFDEEEYNSAVEKSEKEREESLSVQDAAIESDKKAVEKELGKTEKNKKLVAKLTYGDHIEYEALYFDKDGVLEYKMTYKYFDTDDYYNMVIGYGDIGNEKIVETDDELRCITYKNKNMAKMDFDTAYSIYSRKSEDICVIAE